MTAELLDQYQQYNDLHSKEVPYVWSTRRFTDFYLNTSTQQSKRSAERFLQNVGLVMDNLNITTLRDENNQPIKQLVANNLLEQASKKRQVNLFVRFHETPIGTAILANNARQARYWLHLTTPLSDPAELAEHLQAIAIFASKQPIVYWPARKLCRLCREIPNDQQLYRIAMSAYAPNLKFTLPNTNP